MAGSLLLANIRSAYKEESIVQALGNVLLLLDIPYSRKPNLIDPNKSYLIPQLKLKYTHHGSRIKNQGCTLG